MKKLLFVIGIILLNAVTDLTVAQETKNSTASAQEILMLLFNEPQQKNSFSFEEITGKTIYCYITNDSSSQAGYSYILLSGDELKKIFGLELLSKVTAGAGNNMDTDSYSQEILNKKDLNINIKPLLKDFYLQNDPKFLVYDQASPESCRKYFK